MPQFFDVRRPTGMNEIQQLLAGYTSPEAAEADLRSNAPQGLDYLTRNYSALTGDPFSDPFEDASNVRARSMTEAAMNGASVATGSNRGMSLLSLPDVPVATVATPSSANPSLPISPRGQRTTENSLITSMLQAQGNRYQMAGKDLIVPPPQANDYLHVLEKRANMSGAGELWREIYRNNPNIFSKGTASDDPRFARVQGGKDGKIEAADAIHPLAFDPIFVQETKRNPERAKALYSAVTNGRDYNSDITAKSQLMAEQRDTRQKLIAGIKNPHADPVTGELFKIIETPNRFTGAIEQQKVPLDDLEKAAVEAEGGFKRIFGVDLPNRGGLPAYGETQEEISAHRDLTQRIMAEKKIPAAQASVIAKNQLYQQQQNRGAQPTAAVASEGGPLDALMFTQPRDVIAPVANLASTTVNALKSPLNVLPRIANAGANVLGSNQRFPLIPDIPMMNSSMSREEVEARGSVLEMLKELLATGQKGYASP